MNRRNFLFLQGPASPFLRMLADEMQGRGALIHRINFCLGDAAFWWPKKGDWFKGLPEEWPAHIRSYLHDHAITDLVMLGDGREKHAEAANSAIEAGLRVHILEHGYLRPDWLTLEPDGMSGHSRFPQEPDRIRQLAEGVPPVDARKRYTSSFLTYVLYDLVYHIPNVLLGWLLHPHYRTHGAAHPVVEYSGWIGKALTMSRRRRAAEAAIRASAGQGPFFLFPLQLAGDYQIRRHAPGGNLLSLAEATIASFARHAPARATLLFKVHPIDNGLSGWNDKLREAAARHGVAGRVFVADGGNTDTLIAQSEGVITVNSTVGLTALAAGKPVALLGAAIYDVDGLTHQASLADFWGTPTQPDPALFDAFTRALSATIQVRGGFIGADALKDGVKNVADLLLEEKERLPLEWRKPRGRPLFRYEQELLG